LSTQLRRKKEEGRRKKEEGRKLRVSAIKNVLISFLPWGHGSAVSLLAQMVFN